MDIYVGSIPFKWSESVLKELFEPFGEVVSVKIVINKMTRQNKGFGFVEMMVEDEGKKAIKALDGKEFEGRKIIVNKSEKNNAGSLVKKKKTGIFQPNTKSKIDDKKTWKPFRGNNWRDKK
ncbi:MAG: RNA-binding protein [Pseudarcicella sp.]|jgi:RNA recognition motif-containing protein|nr:RNA-binding protein [Pseudarcicella sp.]MBP6410238.1 RNA-binding protein [Pseudarcicella sp.]